jgi:hypothetical protein
MNTIITTDKPIRYVAHDTPGAWVENLTEPGLVTVRCLYMPMTNKHYTHITDGLTIETERFPNGDFLADCYYVEPMYGRKQERETLRAKSYEDAKVFAEEWLAAILEAHREVIEQYYPQMYEGQITLW